MPQKWTEAETIRAQDLRTAGRSFDDIAKILGNGRTPHAVACRLIRARKPPRKRGGGTPISEYPSIDLIRVLRRRGFVCERVVPEPPLEIPDYREGATCEDELPSSPLPSWYSDDGIGGVHEW